MAAHATQPRLRGHGAEVARSTGGALRRQASRRTPRGSSTVSAPAVGPSDLSERWTTHFTWGVIRQPVQRHGIPSAVPREALK